MHQTGHHRAHSDSLKHNQSAVEMVDGAAAAIGRDNNGKEAKEQEHEAAVGSKKQLCAPQNLRLSARGDSQIIVKWDSDNSIPQTDPTRWCYQIFYTTVVNNKKSDDVVINGNGAPVNHDEEKEIVEANGQHCATIYNVLPNETYSITATVSDTQNEYATSQKCQPLIVEQFGADLRVDVLYIHKQVDKHERKTMDGTVTFGKRDLDFTKFKNAIIKQKHIPTHEKGDYSIDKLIVWLCVIDEGTFELTQENFAEYHDKYISNFDYGSPKNKYEMICYVGWKPGEPKISSFTRKEKKGKLSHLQVYLAVNNVVDQKYVARVCSTRRNPITRPVLPNAQVKGEAYIEINVEEFSNDPKIYFEIGCYNDRCTETQWSVVTEVLSANDAKDSEKQKSKKIKWNRKNKQNNNSNKDGTSKKNDSATNNNRNNTNEENKTDDSTIYLILIATPCDGGKQYYYANKWKRNVFFPFKTLDNTYGVYIAPIPCSIRQVQLFQLIESQVKRAKYLQNAKAIERTHDCIPERHGYLKEHEWATPISSYDGASCMIIDISGISKSFVAKYIYDTDNFGQRYTAALSCVMEYVLLQTNLLDKESKDELKGEEKNGNEHENGMTFAECLHVISRMVEFLRVRKVNREINLAPFLLDVSNRSRKNLRYLIMKAEMDSKTDEKHEITLQRLSCGLLLALLIESINFSRRINVIKYTQTFKKLVKSCRLDLHSLCNKIAFVLGSPDNVCAVLDALEKKLNHVGDALSQEDGLAHYGILVVWYNLIHGIWQGHLVEMGRNPHPEMEKWTRQVTKSTQTISETIATSLDEKCTIINLDHVHQLLALELELWTQDDIDRALRLECLVMDAIIKDGFMAKKTKFSELVFIVKELPTISLLKTFLRTFQGRIADAVIIDLEQWHQLIEIIQKKVTKATPPAHKNHSDIFSILRCEYVKTIRNEQHYQYTTLNKEQVSNTLAFLVNNPDFVNDDICLELINCQAFLSDNRFMKQFLHPYLRDNKKNQNWKTDLNNYCSKLLGPPPTSDPSQIDWNTLLTTFSNYNFEWQVLKKAIGRRKARFNSIGFEIEKLNELLSYQNVSVDIFNLLISFAKFLLGDANDVGEVEQFCVKLIEKDLIVPFEDILEKCENKRKVFDNMNRHHESQLGVVDSLTKPTNRAYLGMLIRLVKMLPGKCAKLDSKLATFEKFWDKLTRGMMDGNMTVSLATGLAANNWEKFDICDKLYSTSVTRWNHKSSDTYNEFFQQLQNIKRKFDQINKYINLLTCFHQHFMAPLKTSYCNQELTKLKETLTYLNNAKQNTSNDEFLLKELFDLKWIDFDSIETSLKLLKKYETSSIAKEIWQDIVEKKIKSWTTNELKDKTTYEVRVWLHEKRDRLNAGADFDSDIFAEWVLDREIDGKQLIELANTENNIVNALKNWIIERSGAFVGFDRALYGACLLLELLVEVTMEQEKILKSLTAVADGSDSNFKKFSFGDINEFCIEMINSYAKLGRSIETNKLTVLECKHYFGNMFRRGNWDLKEVVQELCGVASGEIKSDEKKDENINEKNVEDKSSISTRMATDINSILEICANIEAQPIIINCTHAFSDIFNKMNGEYDIRVTESDEWHRLCYQIQTMKREFDNLTVKKALEIYEKNKKYFVVLQGDPERQKVQIECLRMISSHHRSIGELVEQFGNDEAFRDKMETWHRIDDMQKGQNTALKVVRRVIVDSFIRQQLLKNVNGNKTEFSTLDLRNEVVTLCGTMTQVFLDELKTVTSQWHIITKLTIDQMTYDFQENSRNLKQIYSFHFKQEKQLFKNMSPAHYKRANNYLTIELANCHNEAYIFSGDQRISTITTNTKKNINISPPTSPLATDNEENKDVEITTVNTSNAVAGITNTKATKATKAENDVRIKKMANALTTHQFTTGIDNILLYLASDCVTASGKPVQNINELSVKDVVSLFETRKQQLSDERFDILVKIVNDLKINGKKLSEATKACGVDDIDPMSKLFNYGVDTRVISTILKIVNFEQLRETAEDALKKYGLVEKILNFRLIYYAEGGRKLLEQDRCIQITQDITEFENISAKWKQQVLSWQKEVNRQRQKYPILSFFTVNDMRFIWQQMKEYLRFDKELSLIHDQNNDIGVDDIIFRKGKALKQLYIKLSFIDNKNISSDNVESLVASKESKDLFNKNDIFDGKKLEPLGAVLKEHLEDNIKKTSMLPGSKEFDNKIFFDKGRPYLYHCERESEILDTVLKLFILQNQIPSPSRVLFCNELTTQEALECFLQRLNINTGNKMSILHCLVQPENLSLKIKDKFVDILQEYMYGDQGLLAVVMCNKKHPIFEKLRSYYSARVALTQYDRKTFFEIVLQKDWDTFCKSEDKSNMNKPFCGVFLSQQECVGKSFVIQKTAKEAKYPLIHIPIMTKTVDYTFVVSKLNEAHNHLNSKRILYHIDVSSDAGFDVNALLFKLLVLRHVSAENGESFHANGKHGFLVELPSKLSSLKRNTSINDVRRRFSFIAETNAYGIYKIEVIDALRDNNSDNNMKTLNAVDKTIKNKLEFTEKEKFVIKYLDALQNDLIENKENAKDWDFRIHREISDETAIDILKTQNREMPGKLERYCEKGLESLVLLKSYLQYCYQHLMQLYTAKLFSKNLFSQNVAGFFTTRDDPPPRYIQYHKILAHSIITAANHIACHMYEMPVIENREPTQQLPLNETTGNENFFLVDFWSQADPPLALLNQRGLKNWTSSNENDNKVEMKDDKNSKDKGKGQAKGQAKEQIDQNKKQEAKTGSVGDKKEGLSDLEKDLQAANKHDDKYGAGFSLLAKSSKLSQHPHSQEYEAYRKVMENTRHLDWKIYDFESEIENHEKMIKERGFIEDGNAAQMEKLKLLMRVCGAFESQDPKKQQLQCHRILNENKNYALTFDNILKIIAIFFRIQSGIPLLIMGETGCGKTRLLRFMGDVLGIKIFTIDVHGGYTMLDLADSLKTPILVAQSDPEKTVLVFLDEVNTSPHVGAFKEVICDHSLQGTKLPPNVIIVGALNPYRLRFKTKKEEADDIQAQKNVGNVVMNNLDREISKLVYRVFPLPPSMKTYIWNFGALSQQNEQQYIVVMTRMTWNRHLRKLSENGGHDDDEKYPERVHSPSVSNMYKQLQSDGRAHIKIKTEEMKLYNDHTLLYIHLLSKSQEFLRNELQDVSVCSLREIRRCNDLFIWFMLCPIRHGRPLATKLQESIILSLTQCYYYRLFSDQRDKYEKMIEQQIKQSNLSTIDKNVQFKQILKIESEQYVGALRLEETIARNHAFCENIYVMLVALATQTPIIVVGKPGSSKTLAMATLRANLDRSTKNVKFSNLGFRDYKFESFQCSKTNDAASIEERWDKAVKNQQRSQLSTILVLDEIGLAEHSPHRPLKVLHKLLENPEICFIGLSNWTLDSAKMNRVILHRVIPPNNDDLRATATAIVNRDNNPVFQSHIQKIANIYETILKDMDNTILSGKSHNGYPFHFDFFGHRDFYSLINYLKYKLNTTNIKDLSDEIIIDAILRNFGGLSRSQAQQFLLPKIRHLGLKASDNEEIWNDYSPLNLIRDNIEQTREEGRSRMFEMRNIMLIESSPALWKILFDCGVLTVDDAEVIFGSKFDKDIDSNIHLYNTLQRVRSSMASGKVCILLKLDQLYDSMYDVLNQKYLKVSNQCFANICIRGETIRCLIHPKFRCIVVCTSDEAHHSENIESSSHVPVAFLNRFEKQYLDKIALKQIGFGDKWKLRWRLLEQRMEYYFKDHWMYHKKNLFVGYDDIFTKSSLLNATPSKMNNREVKTDEQYDEEKRFINAIDQHCIPMLLSVTSIEYLIRDGKNIRCELFDPYSHLASLVRREMQGKKNLLHVTTHDNYQVPSDFNCDEMIAVGTGDARGKELRVLFKDLHSFATESEFYKFVYDFFNSSIEDPDLTESEALVIYCEPVKSSDELLHLMHAQYLIEKANNGNKTVVFLIFMNRGSKEYPLVFSKEWKHLFLDALLPANHKSKNHIEICDLNVENRDHNDEYFDRITQHGPKLCELAFEKAMNHIKLTSSDEDQKQDIEEIQKLIKENDKSDFGSAVIDRVLNMIKEDKDGAIANLKTVLRGSLSGIAARGSLRAHINERLSDKIMQQLTELIITVLEYGNFTLYRENSEQLDKKTNTQSIEDKKNQRKILWLSLMSDIDIVRTSGLFAANSQVRPQRIRDKDVKFPFSTHINSYFSSFKDSAMKAYHVNNTETNNNNENNSVTIAHESGIYGQKIFTRVLQQWIRGEMKRQRFIIDNLPEDFVREFIFDIIGLSNVLPINLQNCNREYLDTIVDLVWLMCQNMYALEARNINANSNAETNGDYNSENNTESENGDLNIALNFDPDAPKGDVSSDDSDSDSNSDSNSDDEDREAQNDENDKNKSNDDQDDGKDEVKINNTDLENRNSQICHVYAALWANERLLCEFCNVLKCLEDTSLEIHEIRKELEWKRDHDGDGSNDLELRLRRALNKILDGLKKKLERGITESIGNTLLSSYHSFEFIFNYLCKTIDKSSMDAQQSQEQKKAVNNARRNFLRMKLATQCVQIAPTLSRDDIEQLLDIFDHDDYRFDNLDNLDKLLDVLTKRTRGLNNGEERLYWLLQTYMRSYAFCDELNSSNGIYDRKYNFNHSQSGIDRVFVDQIVTKLNYSQDIRKTTSDEISSEDNAESKIGGICLNLFTKHEIVRQILNLIIGNDNNHNENRKYNYIDIVNSLFENQSRNYKINRLYSVMFVYCYESILRSRLSRTPRLKYKLPDSEEIETVVQNLNQAKRTCDRLLAATECKIILWRIVNFVKWQSATMTSKGFKIPGKTGTKKKGKYIKLLGKIFEIKEETLDDIKKLKRGLQYYLLRCLWKNLDSSTKAMSMLSEKSLNETLNLSCIEVQKKTESKSKNKKLIKIPNDDTWNIHWCINNHNNNNDDSMEQKTNSNITDIKNTMYQDYKDGIKGLKRLSEIDLGTFNEKHLLHLIAALFNCRYMVADHSNVNRANDDEIRNYLKKVCIPSIKDIENNVRGRKRMLQLLYGLAWNKPKCKHFEMNNKRSMDQIRLIRLGWHLVGVSLSVGATNPFSILFHSMTKYTKGYLMGMPEDSVSTMFASAQLKNTGVWLCPNDHVYFVANCTETKESGVCYECGAAVGQAVNEERAHTAAEGNRKVGHIGYDGKLVIGNSNYSHNERLINFNIKSFTPTGYRLIETTYEKCRNMDVLSAVIIRFFVNLVIYLHHSEPEFSDAKEFIGTQLNKIDDNTDDSLSNELNKLLNRNLYDIFQHLGGKTSSVSMEDVFYLLHAIVERFYVKYGELTLDEAKKDETDDKNADEEQNEPNKEEHKSQAIQSNKAKISAFCDTGNIEARAQFEDFLVKQCIEPIVGDERLIKKTINSVRIKSSKDPNIHYWSPRIDLNIDFAKDGQFLDDFVPSFFLPFTNVNLSTFGKQVLGNHKNKEQYPVLWGIMHKLTKSEAGYSLFGVKYLPHIITWMRLLHGRLNTRLSKKDLENSGTYNGEYVLERCEKEHWGSVDYWQKALNEFVKGWNHLAVRVTSEKSKFGKQVAGPDEYFIDDSSSDEDDGKDDVKTSGDADINNDEDDEDDEDDDDHDNINVHGDAKEKEKKKIIFKEERKNELRTYLKLRNTCNNAHMDCIESRSPKRERFDVLPCEVPIGFCVTLTEHNEFGPSVQLRLLIQHYIDTNNELLKQCLGIDIEDNDSRLRLLKKNSLLSSQLYVGRESDVIDIDEKKLEEIIQDCYIQPLMFVDGYASNVSGGNGLVNLSLLESRLKERYIIGQKWIEYDPIQFELKGDTNIRFAIDSINNQYERVHRKEKFFTERKESSEDLDSIKLAIEAQSDTKSMENESDSESDENWKLNIFEKPKLVIEQTILALERQKHLVDGRRNIKISDYMRNYLHFYEEEYKIYNDCELTLSDLHSVWKCLNRCYLLQNNKWHQQPSNIHDMYLDDIKDSDKREMDLFMRKYSQKSQNILWDFLVYFRSFLSDKLENIINLSVTTDDSLKTYLNYQDGINEDLVNHFPKQIKLTQAGSAYSYCAQYYAERLLKKSV